MTGRSSTFSRGCLWLQALLFAAGAQAGGVERISLGTQALKEASGLAVSRIHDDLLWVHNDGADGPRLYAIGSDGRLRAKLRIDGARNRDWEDIASFTENGEHYLLVGDVGDNTGARDRLTLYLLREPELALEDGAQALTTEVLRTVRFRLEGGPRDIEGLTVDAHRGEILLLSKRDDSPRLFRLPLHPDESEPVAREVARIDSLPGPDLADLKANFTMAPFLRQPTALDYDSSSDSYLITTYADAHLYRRAAQDDLEDVFSRAPKTVQLPVLPQMEGGGWCAARRLCFISEKTPTWLLLAPLD